MKELSICFYLRICILCVVSMAAITVPCLIFSHHNYKGYAYLSLETDLNAFMNRAQMSFEMFILWFPIGIFFMYIAIAQIYRQLRSQMKICPEQYSLIPVSNANPPQMQCQQMASTNNNKNSNNANDEAFAAMSRSRQGFNNSDNDFHTAVGVPSILVYAISWEHWKAILMWPSTLCIIFVLFAVIPGCWLCTTVLPSDWHQFQIPIPNMHWSLQTPSLSQWTHNWQIGGTNKYLHVYFDTLIYYIALFVTVLFGFIVQKSRRLRHLFRSVLCARKLRKRVLLVTVGQFLVVLLWISTLISIFVMFAFYHEYHTTAYLHPIQFEKILRSAGILATIFVSLSLMPITRGNYIMKYCFGLSFEGTVKYHRLLGVIFMFLCTFHFVGYIGLFIRNDGKTFCEKERPSDECHYVVYEFHKMYPFSSMPWTFHSPNFSIHLMMIVCMFVVIPMFGFMSLLGKFRRRFWNIWYYCHMYGSLVLIIALCWHATQAFYFLLPALILQWFDFLLRFRNALQISRIHSLEYISHNICKLMLNINNKHPRHQLGCYYFINIPIISPFESHPFSVCNPLNNKRLTSFYIKNIGDWSQKLLNLSSQLQLQKRNSDSHLLNKPPLRLQNIVVNIEGPYGVDLDYHNYTRVVLVAGGIGITPMYNVFFTLLNESSSGGLNRLPFIDLVWIVPFATMFEMYASAFERYKNLPLQNMRISLYATRDTPSNRREESDEVNCVLDWKHGRPDWTTEFAYLSKWKKTALVYVCGPKTLVHDCQLLAYKYGNHFKKETFLF